MSEFWHTAAAPVVTVNEGSAIAMSSSSLGAALITALGVQPDSLVN
ncbi:MAG TPA: hypothetical protein VIC29_19555 [Steroidobacteraceae bacterium]